MRNQLEMFILANSMFCHATQHLAYGLFLFWDFKICDIYYNQLRKAAMCIPVNELDFLPMPNHVHVNLKAENPFIIPLFFQRVNTGFSKIVRGMTDEKGNPLVPNGIVFSERPHYDFIKSYEREFDLFRYFANNPDEWESKYGYALPRNQEGEYFPSAVARYMKHDADFIRTDVIEKDFNISYGELQQVRKMPSKEYLDFLAEYKKKHTPEEERNVFLVNPNRTSAILTKEELEKERMAFFAQTSRS